MLHCVQGRDIDCSVAMNPSVSSHLHIVVSVDTFSVMGAFAYFFHSVAFFTSADYCSYPACRGE